MINPVHIGEVIVNGLVFDPKQFPHTRRLDVDQLLAAIPGLFDLLEQRGIDYLMVGGIAMLAYVDGRNTQDIDLIMSAADLEKLPELVVVDRNRQFARAHYGPLQVDLLLSEEPLFARVLRQHSARKEFLKQSVRCVSVEGLMLLKLYALPSLYRQGQFARVELYERDITMLLRDYQPSMKEIFEELASHVNASDLIEIKQIVAETNERIAKAGQRFREES